ncbi:nitrate/nitrite transporter [Thermodesulfobacteriota bacterium]
MAEKSAVEEAKSRQDISAPSTLEQFPPFFSQLKPILFLTLIFFLNFISRIVLAPLLPAIETELGISHGEAGSLFLLISAGYFVSLLCSGFVSSRLTHRKTIALSAISLGTAMLTIASMNSLFGIKIGLILLGMSAGLYIPSGIATITDLIDPRHWGKALAIHELAPNLSFVAAPLISEALLSLFSWRSVLILLGVMSVISGITFIKFSTGGKFPGGAPNFKSFKILFNNPAFWIMMILFSFGIASTMGIFSMLPLYLVIEHGFDRNWANSLIALSRISGLAISFAAGWANDRFGSKRTMSAVFILTGICTIMLGSVNEKFIILFVFLQPIAAVCFFPPGIAALSQIGSASTRNVSVSLTIPASFMLGGGLIPIMIGRMGDAGSFGLGIVLTGGLMLLGALLALALPVSPKSSS